MAPRVHHSELVAAKAGCERCAWSTDGRNALALAARHHDKRGHPTWVESTVRITYGAGAAKPAGQGSML